MPTLSDRERRTIVNNESSEISPHVQQRLRNHSPVTTISTPDLLRGEIDKINELVYSHFNNGVYRAGFARSQEAYDEAVKKVLAV